MTRDEAKAFADRWNQHYAAGGTVVSFAHKIGVHQRTVYPRRKKAEAILGIELPTMIGNASVAGRERMKAFHVTSAQPPRARPVEEIVADRLKSTGRKLKSDAARELVDVSLNVRGPYGIALIGDPHIDNPGCNLQLLIDHTNLIRETDGLFAVCVGDVQDGWVGRLARLWATQGIAADESQQLVDWWLKQLQPKLVALIAGNHDCWLDGMSGASPMDWIRSGGTVFEKHGVRLRLTPKGGSPVTINARHDFPGRSQYNAAHGPNKSLLFGCRDDVAVAGHTHEFGFSVRLDPDSRKPMHAVRLGSYKHSDEYARQLGFLDNNVTECAVLLVDPDEPDPRHRTWIECNPFRAARALAVLRERGKKKRAA